MKLVEFDPLATFPGMDLIGVSSTEEHGYSGLTTGLPEEYYCKPYDTSSRIHYLVDAFTFDTDSPIANDTHLHITQICANSIYPEAPRPELALRLGDPL